MALFEEQLVKNNKYVKYVKKNDDIISYRAKYPILETLLTYLIFIASISIGIFTIVELAKESLELYIGFFILIGVVITFSLSLYFIIRNKFRFECVNETFALRLPFKPEKTLPCVNVEQVDITKFYSNGKSMKYLIIFWSKDGQRYFYFYNNGFILENDILTKLLDTYKIPYTIHK